MCRIEHIYYDIDKKSGATFLFLDSFCRPPQRASLKKTFFSGIEMGLSVGQSSISSDSGAVDRRRFVDVDRRWFTWYTVHNNDACCR